MDTAALERFAQQEFDLRIDRTQIGGGKPLQLVPQLRIDAQ